MSEPRVLWIGGLPSTYTLLKKESGVGAYRREHAGHETFFIAKIPREGVFNPTAPPAGVLEPFATAEQAMTALKKWSQPKPKVARKEEIQTLIEFPPE